MKRARRQNLSSRAVKISVSLDPADLAAVRRRARRFHGGSVSAALAEGVRRLREEEGREALVTWLGGAGRTTAEERESIRAAWRSEFPTRRRRSKIA
jgi:hypothetical protein